MVKGVGNKIILNTATVGQAIREYFNSRLQEGVNIRVLDVNQREDDIDLFDVEIKDGGDNA